MSSLEISNDNESNPSAKTSKVHKSGLSIKLCLLRIRLICRRCQACRCSRTTSCFSPSTIDKIAYYLTIFLSVCFISFAMMALLFLSFVFFFVYLPLVSSMWVKLLHTLIVLFFVINITFNYYNCVMTRHDGSNYEEVVRELANVMGLSYPETKAAKYDWKMDYQMKMISRRRERESLSSNSSSTTTTTSTATTTTTDIESLSKTSTTKLLDKGTDSGAYINTSRRKVLGDNKKINNDKKASGDTLSLSAKNNKRTGKKTLPEKIYNWMLLGPQEWGYCNRSNQPKPPRSHYDDVVKCLVLNMDHFCPWMFNTVGYFNYRFFVNVLVYTFIGTVYGALITFQPFWNTIVDRSIAGRQSEMSRSLGYSKDQHLLPMVPTPNESIYILLSFIGCIALGLGVFVLMSFHVYLILTAQTTVECHGNLTNRRKAKREGKTYKNPYDLGWRLNWQQVYGSRHPLIAMLPSSQLPEYLPLPINGKLHRRQQGCLKLKEGKIGTDTAAWTLETSNTDISRRGEHIA